MLMLLFYAGKNLYAIESSCVVEVIPKVALRKIHHVPEYITGLFNYHSTIIPIIDLCYLIQGSYSHSHLSTRIMIVSNSRSDGTTQYLGLIANRVTETLSCSNSDIIYSSTHVNEAPYLSGTIIKQKTVIQCIHIEQLFSDIKNCFLTDKERLS
jgi:chemotaxis-related protein WspB